MTANKKSSNPTQLGHRFKTSQPTENRKQDNIIQQFALIFKSLSWKRRLFFPLTVIAILFIAIWERLTAKTCVIIACLAVAVIFSAYCGRVAGQPADIFTDDGTPVNMQAMTTAWASEAGYDKRYDITDAERWELASAITAEAAGEPFAGKVAVAQCMLQACEDDGIRPGEALKKYGYSKSRPEPCDEALKAVQAVFDHGDRATTEPIKYYYAPALVYSDWHETQSYVVTINNHRFFKEKGAQTNGKSN